MESLLVVAQILALLSLSALCIYVIVVLFRVRDLVVTAEKDLKEMTSRALPVLENMEFITARVRTITENIDDQVVLVRESIASFKRIADNVVDLERKVQDRIEGPILETVGFFAAVFKGLRAFVDRVRT